MLEEASLETGARGFAERDHDQSRIYPAAVEVVIAGGREGMNRARFPNGP